MSDIKIKVGLDMGQQEVNKVLKEIKNLQNQLEMEIEIGNEQQLKALMSDLNKLAISLKGSMNETFGKVNVQQFERNMKQAKISINGLEHALNEAHQDADELFNSFRYGADIISSSVKRQQNMVEKLSDTLVKTASWSLANRAFDMVAGSVQQASRFMKDLDESLTNISIVSNMSKNELKEFAEYANEASKALGQTTVAYTEGALLYLQQGKTLAEAQQLTQATLIGANITGESTADIAELLTASLNGYNLAAKDAMDVTDKFAAVGAATGSDFNELATAFSKTASMASIAGVSFDQLTAQIATISTVTREAPESIGTSLKTIFGRMTEIKDFGSDEEGMTFGKVKDTLDAVGISIVDADNNLRDMGVVIEEVGDSWIRFDRNTQLAIANALAGSRQANRLIALFQNWSMYQDALTTSLDSSGDALMQQQKYMDSIEAKTNELRASMEELFSALMDEEGYKQLLDSLSTIVGKVADIVEGIGGLQGILLTLAPLMGNVFTKFLVNVNKDSLIGVLIGGDPFKGFKANFEQINTLMAQTPDKAKFAMQKLGIPEDVILQHEKLIQHKIELENKVNSAKTQIELENKAITDNGKRIADSNAKLLEAQKRHNEYQKELKETRAELELQQKIASGAIPVGEKAYTGSNKHVSRKDVESAPGKVDELTKKLAEQEKQAAQATSEWSKYAAEVNNASTNNTNSRTVIDQNKVVLQQLQPELLKVNAQTNKFSETLKKIAAGKNAMSWAMSLLSVANALKVVQNSMKTFADSSATLEEKMDSLTNMTTSLGMAIMMLPVPGSQLVGALVMMIGPIGELIVSFDKLSKAMKTNEEVINQYNKNIDQTKGRLDTLKAVQSDYLELQKALTTSEGTIGNPFKLSAEDYERYLDTSNALAEVMPEIVKYYDEQGNAIIDLTNNFQDLIDKQNELLLANEKLKSENQGNFAIQYSNDLETAQKKLEYNKTLLAQLESDMIASDGSYNAGVVSQAAELRNEIGRLQTQIKETDALIVQNIVSPLFNGNKAYTTLTKSSKEYAQTLMDSERVSKKLNAPIALENYTKSVERALDSLGEKNSETYNQVRDIQAEMMQIEIGGISDTEKERYIELQDTMQSLEEKTIGFGEAFDSMSDTNKQNVLEFISVLGETDVAIDTLIEKATSYYSDSSKLGMGPMSVGEFEEFGGKDLGLISEETIAKNEERLQRIQSQKAQYLQALEDVSTFQQAIEAGYSEAEIREVFSEEVISNYDEYKDKVTETEQAIYDLNQESNILYEQSQENIGHRIEEAKVQQELTDMYWSHIDALLETAEGQREVGEAYNESIESMGDAEKMMEDFAKNGYSALENYIDDIPGLGEALAKAGEDGGAALDDLMNKYQELADTQGRMYAKMNGHDEEYYADFLERNQRQTQIVELEYGIRANDYKNYQDYEMALTEQIEKGKRFQLDETTRNALMNMSDEEYASWMKNNGMLQNDADSKKTMAKNSDTLTNKTLADFLAMSEAGVSTWDIIKYGAAVLVDKTTGFFANLINGITGGLATAANTVNAFWNGFLSIAVDVINGALSAIEKIPFVGNLVTGRASKGSFQFPTNIKGTSLSGTNLAGSVGSTIVDKYTKPDMPNFDYGSGSYQPGGSSGDKPGGYEDNKTDDYVKPGGTGSGDKGSSDKGGSEKEQEDLEIKRDIYHDINIELKKQNDLLEKLKNTEDDLYGQAKVDNMNAQADTLRKIRDLTAQKLELARQEAKDQQTALSKFGVKFDETGTITNYNDIIQSQLAAANSITDADAKKAAQENVQALQKAMDEYENLKFEVIFDYENELEELREQIQEKILEAIDYKYEVKIDVVMDFQEEMDFFNEFLEGEESITKAVERAINSFASQFTTLEELDNKFKDILNNTELDAEAKREALEQLKEDIMDATLSLKDLKDAVSDLIQDAIEQNVNAVNDLVDSFKNINSEVDDYIKSMELLGKGQDYDAINELLEVQAKSNEGQINLLKQAREELVSLRDSLEEGTEEWQKANEEVLKMDENIRKLGLETMELYRKQLENTFKGAIKEIENSLSGGLGFDKLEKEIEKGRKEQEKYFDATEKVVWGSKMQKKIQEEINKATDPKKREQLQKFYDKEIVQMLEKDKLTEDEVKRAELLYDLTLKQMAVDEARANKTIMRLVRDDQGNWTYQYMADMDKVAEAQEGLSSSLDALMQHDQDVYQKSQDEILERRKEFVADMQELFEQYLSGEIATKEEYDALVKELEMQYNEDMLTLGQEYAEAEQNLAESTLMGILGAYGVTFDQIDSLTEEQKAQFEQMGIDITQDWDTAVGSLIAANLRYQEGWATAVADIIVKNGNISDSWKSAVGTMTGDNSTLLGNMSTTANSMKEAMSNAIGSINSAMGSYETKVDEVSKQAGVDLESIKTNTNNLKDATANLETKTKDVIGKMKEEFTYIKDSLIPKLNDLKGKYAEVTSGVQAYIDKINAAIQANKNLANTPSTPSTPSSGGSSSGSTGSSGSSSGAKPDPGVGSAVRPKSGTRWYYDSAGANPSGNAWQQDLIITKKASSGSHQYNLGRKSGEYLGWMKKTDLVGYKSGGFTGDWSASGGPDGMGGRLALLHQKELVLNKEDTQNILDAVALVRDYAKSLQVPDIVLPGQEPGAIQQTVQINADFSGVKNSSEIENAFDNLVNRAAQYARQLN